MDRSPHRAHPPGRLLTWLLVAYWCALLVVLHWPTVFDPHRIITAGDKIVHFTIYGCLALLLSAVIDCYKLLPGTRLRAPVVVLLCAAQGLVDEFTQPWTGRTFEWWDLAADIAGSLVAATLYGLFLASMFQSQPQAEA